MTNWVIPPPSRKFIRFEGELPQALYRYRSLAPASIERIIEFEIIEEGIYLAGLEELNDPDEGRFVVRFAGARRSILEYWRRSIRKHAPGMRIRDVEALARARLEELVRNNYLAPPPVRERVREIMKKALRVACFTTDPHNNLMWANYATYTDLDGARVGHGGICIEYTCDEDWRDQPFHPVTYSESVPQVNPAALNEAQLVRALFSKSPEWSPEQEWRLAYVLDGRPHFAEGFAVNSKVKVAGSIAAVIFGRNTPESLVTGIISRVGAAKPNVLFKRVVTGATFVRMLEPIAS